MAIISIRLPPDLLDHIDRAADRRHMKRTEFLLTVITAAVAHDEDWPRFVYDRLIASAKGVEKAKAKATEE